MNHNELIAASVNKWQEDESLHPLTCGKDSKHRILVPVEEKGIVVLKCLDCDYVQGWVPGAVIANYSDNK